MWLATKNTGKVSSQKNPPLKFNKAYPSRTAPELESTLQCGYFEDLQQYCGLGFCQSQEIDALRLEDGPVDIHLVTSHKKWLNRLGRSIFEMDRA
jgi:hypothetical protein